jgi:hypothetical protein
MHAENPDARGSTPLASNPTLDPPRVPEARRRFDRAIPTDTRSKRSFATGATFAALTVLYAVLAGLVGLLADLLANPPAVVTAIIIAAASGVLIANEVNLRGPTGRGLLRSPEAGTARASAWDD